MSPGWRWLVAFGLALLAVGVISIEVERRDSAASARKFCKVVSTMDDAYRETPPKTVAGQNMADSIAELRRELGCPS